MPPKKNKHFSVISDRQKRRRISAVRRNLGNVNVTQNVGTSSSSSSTDSDEGDILPVEAGDFVVGDINFIRQGLSDIGSSSSIDEESALSHAETVSSNEQETDDEDAEEVLLDVMEYYEVDDDLQHVVEEDVAAVNRRKIRNAFLSAGLTHKQGNILLRTLRENPFRLPLPKDSRTVLGTPTFVATSFIQDVAGGEYLHLGFKDGLLKKLQIIPENKLPEYVEIDFSTDGGNLDKANEWTFWPHHFRIFNIPDKRPIMVGLFKGRHKPSNAHDFFDSFITEIRQVIEEGGINVNGRRLPLRIRCFIADAPARAMVLNHFGHNSSNPCSKCTVEGQHSDVDGYRNTMCYLGTQHRLRTADSYRQCTDEDHHKGESPLSLLQMDLTRQVPFEVMHLVYIGNVKKVFRAKVSGKWLCTRLSARKQEILDLRMIKLKEYCPTDFGRRPREITLYNKFKAVEFRQICLYTAPAILRDVFDENYYSHFMMLHVAMRLLVCEKTPEILYDVCQQTLEAYVRISETLYGAPFLSYNVHGLLHIVDDVRALGPAETFSAFSYENNMPQFSKFVRKPDQPLQQYCKRMYELRDFAYEPITEDIEIQPSQVHGGGPLSQDMPMNCIQFRKLVVGKCAFAPGLRDSCFISKNNEICLIENIVQREDRQLFFIVKHFRVVEQLYEVGLTSQSVGVYHCSKLSNRLHAINLTDVAHKCYRMPKWSSIEGEEETVIPNEWICATLLNALCVPQN